MHVPDEITYLAYNLSTVFRNKLILVPRLFNEDAPSSYIARRLEQMLLQSPLNTHIPTGRRDIQGSSRPTVLTQIWITLSICDEARTLLGATEGSATAAGEPLGTGDTAVTEL